jgi:hypothetical protein
MLATEAFNLGYRPMLLSFAGPLKRQAQSLGLSKKDNPDGYREYCQRIGAEARDNNPNHWVDLFEEDVEELYIEEEISCANNDKYWEYCIIVDDCRYLNEVKVGIDLGGFMVFLSSGDRELENMDAEWRTHHTEDLAKAIDCGDVELMSYFDSMILNDCGLDGLETKARHMAPKWLSEYTDPDTLKEAVSKEAEISATIDRLFDFLCFPDDEEDDDEDDEETQ